MYKISKIKEFPMTFTNLKKRPKGVLGPYKLARPTKVTTRSTNDRYTEAFKKQHVKAWNKSKLTAYKYSKIAGIASTTIRSWIHDERFSHLVTR